MSGWAVSGFVLSLLGLPLVGLIVSIIGYNKAGDPRVIRGRGLAVAGIVIGAAATVVFALVWGQMIAAWLGFTWSLWY